ncbi:MAG: AAA family ATPase [Planctomycetia bacterium]|nr:AAA family ATPase [Planctomycetia bacterium]
MSVPVIAFFNNKGGVGKTSLVYHVSWMLAELGFRVVAADLDPQSNLTGVFLEDDKLELLWPEEEERLTIYGAVRPIKVGLGDISAPGLEPIASRLVLIPGDIALSEFEDDLSAAWPKCLDQDERAFRVMSAFWRVVQKGAAEHEADIVLVDLGPNLGAINRAALIAADFVVIPLGPDLYSLQGMQNLGPRLREWRKGWNERMQKKPASIGELPSGNMTPLGYIVMQHSVRLDRPTKSYDRWIARIPGTYRKYVLDQRNGDSNSVTNDPNCLLLLKHFRSLMPMAQEARKPMFALKPADGALGAHANAVLDASASFRKLANEITRRAGIVKSSA